VTAEKRTQLIANQILFTIKIMTRASLTQGEKQNGKN